ncbi:hypothetical protein [Ruegeria sp.]|uniref:hypothetical protein n=1 Tax=Ruegeria sp. TaxID=1879320 RepID=UPI003B00FBC4
MRWSLAYPCAALPGLVLASGLAAQGPQTPDGQGHDTPAPLRLQTLIGAATETLRQDIETLERFNRRAETLIRIARTDPAEALRQRLPLSDCRASVMAPVCDRMTALFVPEQSDESAGETNDNRDTNGGVQ